MDIETQKIIAEQMKKLPKDVVDAIISVDYKTKLQEITSRQRLLIDQAGKLEMETTLVMIGLEPLADYVGNIQRELGVDIMRAKEISLDVSENIFKPIRESLYAMNNAVESEEEVRTMADTIAKTPVRPDEVTHTEVENHNLDRDQVLHEIENPSVIGKPSVALETLAEVPYQQDIKTTEDKRMAAVGVEVSVKRLARMPSEAGGEAPRQNIMETKMAGMNISTQQIVDATPEVKLPPVAEKKRPSSGFDPYREEIK